MTEDEWLHGTGFHKMKCFLSGRVSHRKMHLFGCACCRLMPQWAPSEESRRAIEVVELFADGLVTRQELRAAREAAEPTAHGQYAKRAAYRCAQRNGIQAGWDACADATLSYAHYTCFKLIDDVHYQAIGDWGAACEKAKEAVIPLLRDFFGNPFRPPPLRPDAIAPLAEQIYAGQWELMPLLGEWLQEHGYWSEGEHCLDPNNHHVKGCWVVDWVTGRE
jgi:hypothetical protein